MGIIVRVYSEQNKRGLLEIAHRHKVFVARLLSLLAELLHVPAVAIDPYGECFLEMTRFLESFAEGERLRLEGERGGTITWDHLEQIALKKSGGLFRLYCVTTALQQTDQTLYSAAANLGEHIGLIQQWAQDAREARLTPFANAGYPRARLLNAVYFEAYCLSRDTTEVAGEGAAFIRIERAALGDALALIEDRIDTRVEEAIAQLGQLYQAMAHLPGRQSGHAYIALKRLMNYSRPAYRKAGDL